MIANERIGFHGLLSWIGWHRLLQAACHRHRKPEVNRRCPVEEIEIVQNSVATTESAAHEQ